MAHNAGSILSLSRLGSLAVGSIGLALVGGAVIAQSAAPEASPTDPAKAAKSGAQTSPSGGGIDPELGPIVEPEGAEVAPAVRQSGSGAWMTPEQEAKARARRESMSQAEAEQQALADAGFVMPREVGPLIPFVPMELLFPPENTQTGPKPVREIQGTGIMLGALDREKGTNVRVKVPVGSQVTYGSLRLKLSACYTSHPDDPLESWAYVEVSDLGRQNVSQLAVLPQRNRRNLREANKERVIRTGWIIASSPAVTPIDHPTYDMWLVSCEGGVMPAKTAAPALPGMPKARSEAKAAEEAPPSMAEPKAAAKAGPPQDEAEGAPRSPRPAPAAAVKAAAPASPAPEKSKTP
ncbi:hypothetical protein PbB2_00974 [Candidatus Phycosocius bacilliformis]|uniref:DUF2155 domain-containing protein n=1 Tax=Candidatus Phycosocius bacilliformis TaxID=1445552 RepID=A0A2P2E8B8_9PROT|nr:DUF2155 domain-containing protein [Candidatus Phycosocius bacilliformis]GBF57309.1 hypothetical protein PbB2_00974 [Candidatus Phycosocius bacilliformis]